MRAAVVKGFGKKSQFVVSDLEKPHPAPDEVLVRIHASSVNPVDWQTKAVTSYLPKSVKKTVKILGHDFAGTIERVGSNVTGYKPGDKVFGTNGFAIDSILDHGRCSGTYADYTCVKTSKIAKKPQNITALEAATIPLVGLTALQGLEKAELKQNDKLLVIGGSGGVGSMVIQIAKAKGARITAVCSGNNAGYVKALGADEVIDYTKQDYLNETERYDIVFNTIGHQSTKPGSHLVVAGGSYIDCAMPSQQGLVGLLKRYARPSSLNNRFFLYHANGEQLSFLASLVDSGELKTKVSKVVGLNEINEAHKQSQLRRTVGKIAININDV